MAPRRCVAVALAAALFGLAGAARGAPLPASLWRAFDPAAGPFYQVTTTRIDQTMTVMGTALRQKQEQTFYLKWVPKEKSKGNWVVQQQILGARLKIDLGGNVIEFDSTDENQAPNAVSDLVKAMVGAELTYHISPHDFSVVKVEGREALLTKLGEAQPQTRALMEQTLSEAALKQMASPAWEAFPSPKDRASPEFREDASYSRRATLDLGPLGTYDMTNTYEWKGDRAHIRRAALRYQAPAKADGNALPFVIKKGDLTGKDEGESFAVLDRRKGRFTTVQTQLKLSGTLTIEIGNMETTVELEQAQSTRLETRDTDPVAEIKAQRAKP
jgi:hypothetical protein